MKGTECTQEQLAHASAFLDGRGWPIQVAVGARARIDIVRLIAWYGALRFTSGRDGTGGSLDSPGELYVQPSSERP